MSDKAPAWPDKRCTVVGCCGEEICGRCACCMQGVCSTEHLVE